MVRTRTRARARDREAARIELDLQLLKVDPDQATLEDVYAALRGIRGQIMNLVEPVVDAEFIVLELVAIKRRTEGGGG